MPHSIYRQQVAVKLETTEGTDATVADANVIDPVYDVSWTPEFQQNERRTLRASFSTDPTVAGMRTATISFATELKGSGTAGTAPPNLSAPLKACRYSETIVASTSVTYKPASSESSVASATVAIREGNHGTSFKEKKIIGARGNVRFVAVNGNFVRAEFEFKGRYSEPSDTTAFTDLATTPDPVAFLGATFSFQSVSTLKISSLTVDTGNEVVLRQDPNQATGCFSAAIVGRMPKGEVDPEQELTSTINFPNKLTTDAEGSMSFILGSTAGNICTFTCAKTQITNASEGDREGIRTMPLTLRFNRNAAAGDDEISIAFT